MMRMALVLGFGSMAVLALAAPAVAQDPVLPDGAGKEQIMAACSACHGIEQVTSQRRTQASWADTVDQMISRGAQVSEADYPIVVAYLAKHYGATPAAPAGKP